MSDFARGIQFFLGANSASGFSSLYDQWVDQAKMQAFYTIKGGAGCGKSTLMRRVADDMEKAGYSVEYICCSGDPDSLDGVYFPEKGAALMDGTSPHVMDPAYTGATGHYVDLGAGYDRTALFAMREKSLRQHRHIEPAIQRHTAVSVERWKADAAEAPPFIQRRRWQKQRNGRLESWQER